MDKHLEHVSSIAGFYNYLIAKSSVPEVSFRLAKFEIEMTSIPRNAIIMHNGYIEISSKTLLLEFFIESFT